MSKNLQLETFRDKANDVEWAQAVNDHMELSPNEYKNKYGFTWSAIMYEAADKGLYKKRSERKSSPVSDEPSSPKAFVINNLNIKGQHKQSSFLLEESVYMRLHKLFDDNPQYANVLIFSKLVDEALQKYGY